MCRRSPPLGWRTGLDDAHTHLKNNSAPLSLLLLRLPERNAHTQQTASAADPPTCTRCERNFHSKVDCAISLSVYRVRVSRSLKSHCQRTSACCETESDRFWCVRCGSLSIVSTHTLTHTQAHSAGLLPCWCWCWFAFSSIVAYCQLDDTRRMVAHNCCCCCGQCLASMDVH